MKGSLVMFLEGKQWLQHYGNTKMSKYTLYFKDKIYLDVFYSKYLKIQWWKYSCLFTCFVKEKNQYF